MKILQLGAELNGGVSNYISNITNYSKNIVFFIPINDFKNTNSYKILYGENVNLVKYDQKYKLNFIKNILKLKSLIKENEIDIIHAHVLRFGFLAAMYKVFLDNNIKIVYTGHGIRYTQINNYSKKKIFKIIEIIINFKSNAIVFIRKFEFNIAIKEKIVSIKKAFIINTRIDLSRSKNNFFSIRERINFNPKKIIAMVGTLYEIKNPDLFFKVAKNIVNDNDEVVFIWIGDGLLLDHYINLVENENLSNKIVFLGNINYEYMSDVWSQIDILFLTSKIEIMPLIVLEAFSSETLVISSNFDGVEDLIDNFINGYIYNMDNFDEVINLIKKVLANQYDIENITKNAKDDFIKNFFNPSIMADEYLKIYKSL